MRKENYFTAIKVALLIGTVLNLINSYDAIFNGEWSTKLLFKIVLTYCVPFGVSLYSSWKAIK
ncbi:MAG: nitrate/nitrite transporter NrtS [Bacteroidetes bacterium]|nr:nitrate/nitrite transporter NrtS [Bacteroidota bacterium]